MFALIASAAILLFLSHVVLLFTSFPAGSFRQRRYFWSHTTLWITGILVFILALLFAGNGNSGFIDYFDTPVKKVMILLATGVVSLLAHGIVRLFVLKYR